MNDRPRGVAQDLAWLPAELHALGQMTPKEAFEPIGAPLGLCRGQGIPIPSPPGIKPQPVEKVGGPARHPRRLGEAPFSRRWLEGEPGTSMTWEFPGAGCECSTRTALKYYIRVPKDYLRTPAFPHVQDAAST